MNMQPQNNTIRNLMAAALVATALTALAFLIPHRSGEKLEAHSPLDPNLGVEDGSALSTLQLREQKNHPVTDSMKQTAATLEAKPAPDFDLLATNGRRYNLAGLSTDKPLLIFFIEKKCPCCLGAKYFVDKMVDLYHDELNAVGIINAEGEVAKAWEKTTHPKFLVLEDPQQKVIRAYKAERGVYTTLVAPGGTIDVAYPGYNLDMLRDLGKRVARLARVPEREVISSATPKEMTSGCLFPEVEEENTKK